MSGHLARSSFKLIESVAKTRNFIIEAWNCVRDHSFVLLLVWWWSVVSLELLIKIVVPLIIVFIILVAFFPELIFKRLSVSNIKLLLVLLFVLINKSFNAFLIRWPQTNRFPIIFTFNLFSVLKGSPWSLLKIDVLLLLIAPNCVTIIICSIIGATVVVACVMILIENSKVIDFKFYLLAVVSTSFAQLIYAFQYLVLILEKILLGLFFSVLSLYFFEWTIFWIGNWVLWGLRWEFREELSISITRILNVYLVFVNNFGWKKHQLIGSLWFIIAFNYFAFNSLGFCPCKMIIVLIFGSILNIEYINV